MALSMVNMDIMGMERQGFFITKVDITITQLETEKAVLA